MGGRIKAGPGGANTLFNQDHGAGAVTTAHRLPCELEFCIGSGTLIEKISTFGRKGTRREIALDMSIQGIEWLTDLPHTVPIRVGLMRIKGIGAIIGTVDDPVVIRIGLSFLFRTVTAWIRN